MTPSILGAGREVTAISSGVTVDTTPPEFLLIYHLDMAWDRRTPVTHQSSLDSIAVTYIARDNESQVYSRMY